MLKRYALSLLAAFGLASLLYVLCEANHGAAQTGVVIIVNASTSTGTVSKSDLSKIFMRQTSRWSDGSAIKPVEQAAGSNVREAFSKAVHGRSTSAVASFWRQQIFSGRGVPPPERKGDAAVVSYVSGTRGAIGYVSRGAATGGALVLSVRGL